MGTPDCEAAQAAWFRDVARVSGGRVWVDDGHEWVWLPGGRSLMLLFPRRIDEPVVRRGVDFARTHGGTIGAWLDSATDATALGRVGFERGWEPWWMSAPLDRIGTTVDARVAIETDTAEYEVESAERAQLTLASTHPDRAWHAAARVDGRFAGHAWAHLAPASDSATRVAGVFDMAVWPRFRRRGLGAALLQIVCTAAAEAGARDAVLNATPMGADLYATRGFSRVGTGITWWWHG